jgi:ATP-binding cassette, subfamily B, bacterial PglK
MIFSKLWSHLSNRRQKQFFFTLALMILASLLEVVSIGAVIPFLGVLIAPEEVFQYEMLKPMLHIFNITTSGQLMFPVTVLFIFAALTAGGIRLVLLYVITRLSYAVGADLSVDIYRRTLYQDYLVNVSRNSSEIVDGIITKTNIVIRGILNPVLVFISSSILIIFIMSTLLVIDFIMAITAFFCFGTLYGLTIYLTRKKVSNNSKRVAENSNLMVKSIQEGLGGAREILINESQDFFCSVYRKADLPLRRAMGENAFISASPRYIMESIGMALIAVFAYVAIMSTGRVDTLLPVLGVLAIGAQRLLPSLQQAYNSYTSIMSAHASFLDVSRLLDQPMYKVNTQSSYMSFEKKIKLKNLSFRYPGEVNWALRNINIQIDKGSCIGFIGTTGSGKSTLIDIIMSLLSTEEGLMTVDDQPVNNKNKRTWRKKISHVPQSIYLSDSSIEENIAFGIPKENIDHQKVKKAAELAQISSVIENLKHKYKTYIGEQGAKLSGGQRQRIGIARALYKDSDILIFDEATSALDSETEQAVMDSIGSLKKNITILVIAHRLTTLKKCDHIVQMDSGCIINIGSYNDVINGKFLSVNS